MMRVWPRQAVSLVNAKVATPQGLASSLRFASSVLAIDAPPSRGDVVIDLAGAFVLPGLINAHDHLELNHYGPLKGRERYANAAAWIDDLRPRLAVDPAIRVNRAYSLASRLFIGGLKNLLAGVTTVAHHNPRYREIGRHVPVRVLRRYGWAHSFQLAHGPVGARGEAGGDVGARYRATSSRAPFIVHAGEGTDEAAAAEVSRLDAMGCLGPNTVLVHGVAITPSAWMRVLARGASVVWCPASNQFLLGQTVPARQWLDAAACAPAHLCLGTDSRLTGARDLLDELRVAAALAPVTPQELLHMVTTAPAHILRLPDVGRLVPGAAADLLVVPAKTPDPAASLLETSRHEIALVTIGGQPMIASPALSAMFEARRVATRRVVVDEVERLADRSLAEAIAACPITEPGVRCPPSMGAS